MRFGSRAVVLFALVSLAAAYGGCGSKLTCGDGDCFASFLDASTSSDATPPSAGFDAASVNCGLGGTCPLGSVCFQNGANAACATQVTCLGSIVGDTWQQTEQTCLDGVPASDRWSMQTVPCDGMVSLSQLGGDPGQALVFDEASGIIVAALSEGDYTPVSCSGNGVTISAACVSALYGGGTPCPLPTDAGASD